MPGDTYWSSVSLLLPFDGTNGSDALVDESDNAGDRTITDGALLSTAQSKWGGASLNLTWPSIDVTRWTGTPFNRTSGQAATIEGWLYVPTGTSDGGLIWEVGNHAVDFGYSGAELNVLTGAEFLESHTLTRDAWHFLQMRVQDDDTWDFLVDGSVLQSGTGLGSWSTGFSIGAQIGFEGVSTPSTSYYIDDVRFTKGYARPTTIPSAAFPIGPEVPDDVDGYIEAEGPLGAPSLLGIVYPTGFVSADGPLGSPSLLGFHDFTSAIGSVLTRYVMDLTVDGDTVRVPISSWQATLQTDRSSYVQCVVPACSPYVDDLTAATAFTIIRRATLPSGTVLEYTMAEATISSLQTSRGPFNFTAVVQGYSAAFAADEDPPALLDRTLADIRFIGIASGVSRVRCAVDWLLRPGQRAYANGDEILVGSISYYVNCGEASAEEYMEVAEQQTDG